MRPIFLLGGFAFALIAAAQPAQPDASGGGAVQAVAAAEAVDVVEAPAKLTKEQEKALRLSSLRFAAQEAERRGDVATALAHYVRAVTVAPNDVPMLTAAGRLALEAHDPKAAFGFLVRAASFAPRDRQIMVLLGSALVQDNRPRDALRIFERASRLGADEASYAADRGLARDLVGEQRRAQRDYAQALARQPGDVAIYSRLALSLAISGDRAGALEALQPLGNKRDSGIQRTIAFTYALLGDTDRAMAIVQAWMPGSASEGMMTFINLLPKLDSGEKARAVHFGDLPADELPRPPATAEAPAAPTRSAARNEKAAKTAKADPGEAVLMLKPTLAGEGGASASASASAKEPAKPAPDPTAMCASIANARQKSRCEANQQALAKRCAVRRSRPTAECVAFAKQVAEPAAAAAKTPTPEPKPAPPANAGEIALAACADIKADGARRTCESNARALAKRCVARPNTAECQIKPQAAAAADPAPSPCAGETSAAKRRQCEIDQRALERRCAGQKVKTAECLAAEGKPAAAAPKADPHPARYWVQVASGANRGALPKEWSRLKAGKAAAFKGQSPFVAGNGRSNRLLIGPFKDMAAARAQVNRLSAAGVSAFPWQSDAGEEVEALGGS